MARSDKIPDMLEAQVELKMSKISLESHMVLNSANSEKIETDTIFKLATLINKYVYLETTLQSQLPLTSHKDMIANDSR